MDVRHNDDLAWISRRISRRAQGACNSIDALGKTFQAAPQATPRRVRPEAHPTPSYIGAQARCCKRARALPSAVGTASTRPRTRPGRAALRSWPTAASPGVQEALL